MGHYVSEVRNLKDSTEQWYLCNDSHVQAIDEPETDSESAYILFYAKANPAKPVPYKTGIKGGPRRTNRFACSYGYGTGVSSYRSRYSRTFGRSTSSSDDDAPYGSSNYKNPVSTYNYRRSYY